jgi:hypothetical protein
LGQKLADKPLGQLVSNIMRCFLLLSFFIGVLVVKANNSSNHSRPPTQEEIKRLRIQRDLEVEEELRRNIEGLTGKLQELPPDKKTKIVIPGAFAAKKVSTSPSTNSTFMEKKVPVSRVPLSTAVQGEEKQALAQDFVLTSSSTNAEMLDLFKRFAAIPSAESQRILRQNPMLTAKTSEALGSIRQKESLDLRASTGTTEGLRMPPESPLVIKKIVEAYEKSSPQGVAEREMRSLDSERATFRENSSPTQSGTSTHSGSQAAHSPTVLDSDDPNLALRVDARSTDRHIPVVPELNLAHAGSYVDIARSNLGHPTFNPFDSSNIPLYRGLDSENQNRVTGILQNITRNDAQGASSVENLGLMKDLLNNPSVQNALLSQYASAQKNLVNGATIAADILVEEQATDSSGLQFVNDAFKVYTAGALGPNNTLPLSASQILAATLNQGADKGGAFGAAADLEWLQKAAFLSSIKEKSPEYYNIEPSRYLSGFRLLVDFQNILRLYKSEQLFSLIQIPPTVDYDQLRKLAWEEIKKSLFKLESLPTPKTGENYKISDFKNMKKSLKTLREKYLADTSFMGGPEFVQSLFSSATYREIWYKADVVTYRNLRRAAGLYVFADQMHYLHSSPDLEILILNSFRMIEREKILKDKQRLLAEAEEATKTRLRPSDEKEEGVKGEDPRFLKMEEEPW